MVYYASTYDTNVMVNGLQRSISVPNCTRLAKNQPPDPPSEPDPTPPGRIPPLILFILLILLNILC